MRIFLNPGHSPNGIPDPGAVNPDSGLRECDVAMKIANEVALFLRKVNYEVKLAQSDSLLDVVNWANDWDSDLFVSIHCNASATHNARGGESWYWNGSNTGRILATAIQSEVCANVRGLWNRGVKEGNFYVLRNTEMPAVLVETAFIDQNDDAYLLSMDGREFARGIALGITDFYAM